MAKNKGKWPGKVYPTVCTLKGIVDNSLPDIWDFRIVHKIKFINLNSFLRRDSRSEVFCNNQAGQRENTSGITWNSYPLEFLEERFYRQQKKESSGDHLMQRE